ncbi:MAG: RNA pyrophosphohydrolase [Pelagibacteraceae bacterium TMED124]|nr:RNA pyrophosphohydrolase [Rickettsiales bacterium]RPG19206.1 MAG: RNA pyrophosphohydrolase [Pelagibacteraceae bacterium TMED124]|tara:strand:+ start:1334 stop:1792 length:459 start_codon:yes stop_codon:yes gene_type:complete
MKDFRKGVGIFLINEKKQLWVGKRIDFRNDYWQMPQGGIDNNENPRQAMIRELSEEVGIKENYEILMELEGWLSYSLPSSLKKIVWNGRYVGQLQKWFACRFFGEDDEFDLETHKPEFEDWKWIKPEDAMESVVPFKKKLYRDVLKGFKNLY